MFQSRDGSSEAGDYGDDERRFFNANPFCGNRVRQSGTMANDLYVKSRWMFGGMSGPLPAAKGNERDEASASPKKKRRVAGSGNTKSANPALV